MRCTSRKGSLPRLARRLSTIGWPERRLEIKHRKSTQVLLGSTPNLIRLIFVFFLMGPLERRMKFTKIWKDRAFEKRKCSCSLISLIFNNAPNSIEKVTGNIVQGLFIRLSRDKTIRCSWAHETQTNACWVFKKIQQIDIGRVYRDHTLITFEFHKLITSLAGTLTHLTMTRTEKCISNTYIYTFRMKVTDLHFTLFGKIYNYLINPSIMIISMNSPLSCLLLIYFPNLK